MDSISSAAIGELVRRTVSSLLSKCERQAATDQEDLKRLCSLLLRSQTILEEAERRHVGSRAMLQQLMALRDKAFRGYYVLDAVACRSPLPGGGDKQRNGDGGGDDDDDEEEVSCDDDALALSRSNAAKRVRLLSSNASSAAAEVVWSGASPGDLRQMVRSLEAMVNDMKEFVVFLMGYPVLYRQPYSAHLFVERCMFGRHMERDMIMEFLLQQTDPPSSIIGEGRLGVLPITGPSLIGKSTIVEHVCNEERVRNHFSLILMYSRNELQDETLASLRDNCVIKHQTDSASEERLLIVIELLEDADDETWKRLYSSARSIPRGSKVIITSRSKKIERFGTTEAIRLKCLPTEAYWYYFKMLVFGSEDPRQHPKLTSLAMEIAYNMPGSFLYPQLGSAILLKGNFSTKRWSLMLTWLREYVQKNNVSLLGEERPDDLSANDQLQCTWTLTKNKPAKYFMLHEIHQSGSVDEVPAITFVDLMLSGCDHPQGKNEVLIWKSRIPPYFNYVCTFDILNTTA